MPFLQNKRSETDSTSLSNDLMQSHTELLQIFEESSIGMAIVSLDGKWIKVNSYLCRILGYSKEELTGKRFNDITHPDDKSIGSDKIREVLEGKIQNFEIEKRYLHKDGSIVHALLNSSLIKKLDGSPKYLISQTKDITALKNSMDALRLSEERLRLVFEKAPIGITHFDNGGNITMVNQFLADIFGSSIEKITQINTRKNITNKKQKEAFEAALAGKIGYFEGLYTSITGGKTSQLKAIYAPLFDQSSSVIGGIGITEDITERKLQEQKLVASLHEKELLLQEVYHRVKNNLQTVISLINIQMNESDNEEFIAGLKETKSRLYAMAKVHEVLCQSENFVSISLSNYIHQLIDNIVYPNVNYNIHIPKDIALSVNQTNSLGIIINELITNSIKHNAGQRLNISLDFGIGDKGKIEFKYTDNGMGLSETKTNTSSSLGMNLVNLLVGDQLEGKITSFKENGFHVVITFKASS